MMDTSLEKDSQASSVLCTLDVHSYGTRQSTSEDLFQPRRRTTQYGINKVHYFGATLWNSIDDDIKNPTL